MKKQLLIIATLTAFTLKAQCQDKNLNYKYSLILDSLKAKLPALKDSARVDCLNAISETFVYLYNSYNSPGFKTRGDSMSKYSAIAYKEASGLGYKYGMGISLLDLALASRIGDNKDSTSIYNNRKAMAIGKEIQNEKLLGLTYLDRPEGDNMENYKQALYYFQRAGDQKMELETLTNIVWDYTNGEQSVEGIDYAERAIQVAQKIVPSTPWEDEMVQWSYKNMADLYKTAGDYQTALDYVRKSDIYGKATDGMKEDISFSELYYLMGKYDSAAYYWDFWNKDYATYHFGHQAFGNTLRGNIYLKKGDYDKAIAMFNLSLNAFRKDGKYNTKNTYGLARPMLAMGEAYAAKNDNKTALSYATQGLGYAMANNINQSKINGFELISRIYYKLGKSDSAYLYLRKYITLKDSVQNNQFIWRLNNYKKAAADANKEARIGFLNKDNKIKEQQLKQEATFKKFLIAVFISVILAGLYVFRNLTLKRKNEKLESEKKQAELYRQAAELEMQALRAQMNPHFIFNCLSSINRFILKNESKTASNYLTRFSRLIRMVLINSQKPLITLEDELQMLRLYLDMERLRFKESFDFSITFLNAMDDDNIFIPPLLLQPFCENAIWHGLMHKDGQGRLDITLSLGNNILYCTITDNGIGREKAEEIKSKSAEKEKSMGLKITTERLALLNREKGVHTSYQMEDLLDENGNPSGTKVHLRISYKESVEAII
ncbi:tetratricopeptide repeat-containing sensor histidine kinase [Flavihumibacter profundi]|uniref:tetratricopeptide repeat-containing sensor histidine kinase n=1 Tax=Flavihumibacter profundi TaxID=2716883 RepID=UPI001CC71447|nr:histidine kinase [Flavihumibacter profundi]MBZ5857175.1 histidine kinase [Flavihumibacter profundi]